MKMKHIQICLVSASNSLNSTLQFCYKNDFPFKYVFTPVFDYKHLLHVRYTTGALYIEKKAIQKADQESDYVLLLINKHKPSAQCPWTATGQTIFWKELYSSSYCNLNSSLHGTYFEVLKGYTLWNTFWEESMFAVMTDIKQVL